MNELAKYKYDVFISYSHVDRAWVWDELLPQLEGAGLRVCIDDRDFEPGLPSLVNMENAVERSRKTLIVLTPAWVESEWATFEGLLIQTDDPAGRRARMIPLRLKSCKPPKRIAVLTYVDLTQPSEVEFQLQRLVAAIRGEPMSDGPRPVSDRAQDGWLFEVVEASELEDTKPKQRVQIYVQGDFPSLSADRRSAAIDAFAALMGIPPQAIEVYSVYEGSIVFDLGIPSNAVQRLRSLLQSNDAQLRVLKVEKVIFRRESGEIEEEWVIKEGKFDLVTSPHPTMFRGGNRKVLQDFLPDHWLIIATGGIGAYVAFLAGLKGALPDLSRNELFGLYSAITGLLIVICLIAIPVTRRARIPLPTKGELTRILSTWIVSGFVGIFLFLKLVSPSPLPYIWDRLCSIVWSPSIVVKVDREDGTSRLVSRGQSVVVRPGERVTLTVGLDPLPNLCRDYSFLPTSRFGDVRTLSSYELEYVAPKREPVDYIVVYATNQRTGQRLEQPFNVVIQE